MREVCVWACTGGKPEDCVEKVKRFAEYMGVPTAFHWYSWHQIRFDTEYPHYFPTWPGVPEEKLVLLKMLGAVVMPTPDELCPVDNPRDGAIALARAIAESPRNRGRYAMPDQYANPDNVRAHYETTGPEIWEQTEGRVRVFVAGYGTCGTLTGVGRFLKEQDPGVRVVAVEPQQGHRLPGLKNLQEAKAPAILDRSVVDEVIRVEDPAAYAMTKRLFREEGLIVGPSTGAIAHAIATLDHDATGLVVGVSPDSGQKYASYYASLVEEEGAAR